jgi:hypothetical protein
MEEESDGSDVTRALDDSDAQEPDAPEPAAAAATAAAAAAAAEGATDADADADAEGDVWDSDDWDSEGSEGAGWFADPDVEGQERYFDGSEWTSETRSADPDLPLNHLPEHTGELQRALAAATADIDEVEDRLGSLFDRAEQRGQRGGRARQQAEASGRAAEGQALAESVPQDEAAAGSDGAWGSGDGTGADEDLDDDDAFAELDEALASEEPEQVKKGLFRRRS